MPARGSGTRETKWPKSQGGARRRGRERVGARGVEGNGPAWEIAETKEEAGENEESFSDGSLEEPTPGFASVEEAVEAQRRGQFVVVMDDEDRENEGDLILPAEAMAKEKMAFMVRHTSGVVCAAMPEGRADALGLPLMVSPSESSEPHSTAFTVTCDSVDVGTGISATERAHTLQLLGRAGAKPEDFRRPGHIFPLRSRAGGVLKRGGHTEASVELAALSGHQPVGVLSELVRDGDGEMQRLQDARQFANEHGLPVLLISDLIRYMRVRRKLVDYKAVARLPTKYGEFSVHSFSGLLDGIEHVALVKGEVGDGRDILARVHSECLTGDIFGSARCDCGQQLDAAMRKVQREGRGVIVYLRGQEGRGIGLSHKLRAYNLQDRGRDTVQANEDLGLPVDDREYGIGAQILKYLGVKSLHLMTNNPAKYKGIRGFNIEITRRVPLVTPVNPESRKYVDAKRRKLGHLFADPSNPEQESYPDEHASSFHSAGEAAKPPP